MSEGISVTILNVVGKDSKNPIILANVSPPDGDPEEISSYIMKLSYKTDAAHQHVLFTEGAWITAIAQTPSGMVIAVDMDGVIYKGKDKTWDKVLPANDVDYGYLSVWAFNDEHFVAVGTNGVIFYTEKEKTNIIYDPTGLSLNAIHGRDIQDAVIVGDKGRIVRYTKSGWGELGGFTDVNLLAVYYHYTGEVYVAGTHGSLFCIDINNQTYKKIDCPNITITSLAWFQDALHIAAGINGVYRYKDGILECIKDNRVFYELNVINDKLFACGNDLVARYDGNVWLGGPIRFQ